MLVSVVGITAKKIRDFSGLSEGFDVAHNDGRIGSNREALSNGAVDDAQSQRVACVDGLRFDVGSLSTGIRGLGQRQIRDRLARQHVRDGERLGDVWQRRRGSAVISWRVARCLVSFLFEEIVDTRGVVGDGHDCEKEADFSSVFSFIRFGSARVGSPRGEPVSRAP